MLKLLNGSVQICTIHSVLLVLILNIQNRNTELFIICNKITEALNMHSVILQYLINIQYLKNKVYTKKSIMKQKSDKHVPRCYHVGGQK